MTSEMYDELSWEFVQSALRMRLVDMPRHINRYFPSIWNPNTVDITIYNGVAGFLYTNMMYSRSGMLEQVIELCEILVRTIGVQGVGLRLGSPLITSSTGSIVFLQSILQNRTSSKHTFLLDAMRHGFRLNRVDSLVGTIGALETILTASTIRHEVTRHSEMIYDVARVNADSLGRHLVWHDGRVRLFQNDGALQPIVGVAHGGAGLLQLLGIIFRLNEHIVSTYPEIVLLFNSILNSELSYFSTERIGVRDFRTSVLDLQSLTSADIADLLSEKIMEGWCSGAAGIIEIATCASVGLKHIDLSHIAVAVARAYMMRAHDLVQRDNINSIDALSLCHGLASGLSMINAVSGLKDSSDPSYSLLCDYRRSLSEIVSGLQHELNPGSAESGLGLFLSYSGLEYVRHGGSVSMLYDASIQNSTFASEVAMQIARSLAPHCKALFEPVPKHVSYTSIEALRSDGNDLLENVMSAFESSSHYSSSAYLIADRAIRLDNNVSMMTRVVLQVIRGDRMKVLTLIDGNLALEYDAASEEGSGEQLDVFTFQVDLSTLRSIVSNYLHS